MQNYKGIYGYWDKKKKKVVYVGKDSNMGEYKRGGDHIAPSNISFNCVSMIPRHFSLITIAPTDRYCPLLKFDSSVNM